MSSPVCAALPLTPERFGDLEALFAQKGCSFARGCWCMEYREARRPAASDGPSRAALRKMSMRELAATLPSPGLIGYDAAGEPVGWTTLGPREFFAKLQRSPVMKPVDAVPVWSVVCFVVPSLFRGRGVASALLSHALHYARSQGARAIEGYPIDKPHRSQDQWLWHGAKRMFDRAGFREIARRRPERPIMRLDLD
jgi:GNAT superfamily N-acetyltransferase